MGAKYKIYFLLLLALIGSANLDAKYYIATHDIKVKAAVGNNTEVIGIVKNHSHFEATQIDNNWYVISYNGKDGYILAKYIKAVPEVTSGKTTSTGIINKKFPFGLDSDSVVAFIISLVVVVVVIRQVRNYILARKARLAYQPVNPKMPAITNWYQCKHCRVAIRHNSEPRISGCSQSLRHLWVNLGEIGELKYICRNCTTIITVRSEPPAEGCPNDGMHQWKNV